eukprot:gene17276-19694_t
MEPLVVEKDQGPNKAMRKMLAERWKQLPDDKKITLRAARAKSGVKCVICGKIGYYMENCPNGCTSPPGTPDSWASTPPGTPPKSPIGLGVLWGDRSGQNEESPGRYDYLKKVDVNTVRPQAQKEQKRLHELDEKVGTFAFFAESEEGYADSYSQLTLHQVMRRLMRLLERQLHQNTAELEAKFDTTLLHPPKQKVSETFYPEELKKVKEYRDYFIEKEKKKGHKKIYQNQSSVRCADELDPLFRGGSTADDFLYKVNPHAGASMHSKNTWKSVLSHSDELATSDPTMAKKEAKLQTLFNNQSKWIKMQQTGMAHKNDRFEHLVNILRDEMKQEHSREATLLETSKHGTRAMQMKIYQERLESVDRIMSCLSSYNFTSGLDEADFLLFCFDRWKQTLHGKVYGKNLHRTALRTTVHDDDTTANETASAAHSISSSTVGFLKKKDKDQPNAGTGLNYNRMIAAANPYAQDMAFLQYMKKKHHKMRVKAMEGSGIEIADYSQSHLQGNNTQKKKHTKGQSDDEDDDLTDDMGNPIRPVRKQSILATGEMGRQVSFNDLHAEAQHKNTLRTSLSAGASVSSMLSNTTTSLASIEENATPLQMVKRSSGTMGSRGSKGRTTGPAVLKRRKHQREIDADKIDEAKGAFRRAGLKGNIRAGIDDDLAYLAPTLIPVPGAFQADGSNPMSSHT